MSSIIHFEIHADAPERAMSFYAAVFGWTFAKWEGPLQYWLITAGSGGAEGLASGGLFLRQGSRPAEGAAVNAFVCTVRVEDVDGTVEKVLAAGGSRATPKMSIPGVGWLAYCKDTEGNIFGVMQSDGSAT